MTQAVIKRFDPSRGVSAYVASPEYSLPFAGSSDEVAEASEPKRSGAPLPNANKVTPANDSEIPNFKVMYSKAGDKYASAVDPKLYMNMNKRNV